MNSATQTTQLEGPAGAIEVALDAPPTRPRGLALIAHPHPLFGGTLDNKVVQTLARAFVALGYLAARPNFRGVGATAGTHDNGIGETDDLLAVAEKLQRNHDLEELVLAGFSFGSFVQAGVAQRLLQAGRPPKKVVLVATAVSRWEVPAVPSNTLLIHGEKDDTVPLSAVLDWANPLDLAVVVIPGADHFFHHKLTLIKRIVIDAWQGEMSAHSGAAVGGE
ncbi:MAG: alpha/beta hydrolase [Burkholderiaceae bacterium]